LNLPNQLKIPEQPLLGFSMDLATNPSTISYFHYFWFTLLPFFCWCCLFKGDTISSKGRETSAAAFPLLVYDCVARRRKQSGSTVGGYAAAFSVKPFHYVLVEALITFTWSMSHSFHNFFLWAPIILQKFFLTLPFLGIFQKYVEEKAVRKHKKPKAKKRARIWLCFSKGLLATNKHAGLQP
jgi:hypothetical protein